MGSTSEPTDDTIHLDATQRELAELRGALADRNAKLQQADADKTEFLALISHELRTPITTIYGAIDVFIRHAAALDDASKLLMLQDVRSNAERLIRILHNLLIVVRLDAADVEAEPVRIGNIIERAVALEQRDHPGRVYRVELSQPGLIGLGNEVYIELVLKNLLGNADRYSPAGQPVEVQAFLDGGEMVVVVRDYGVGIAPAEIERVFEPLYRSERTAVRAGLGIGLSVCRRLVEVMDGRIWAEPREPGSAVSFSLPLVELTT